MARKLIAALLLAGAASLGLAACGQTPGGRVAADRPLGASGGTGGNPATGGSVVDAASAAGDTAAGRKAAAGAVAGGGSATGRNISAAEVLGGDSGGAGGLGTGGLPSPLRP